MQQMLGRGRHIGYITTDYVHSQDGVYSLHSFVYFASSLCICGGKLLFLLYFKENFEVLVLHDEYLHF